MRVLSSTQRAPRPQRRTIQADSGLVIPAKAGIQVFLTAEAATLSTRIHADEHGFPTVRRLPATDYRRPFSDAFSTTSEPKPARLEQFPTGS